MESNGKNGKNRSGWPSNIDVTESPYIISHNIGDNDDDDSEETQPHLADDELPPVVETGRKKSRRSKVLIVCVVALAAICAALGLYAKFGGRKRVDYQVAEKKTVKPQMQQTPASANPGSEKESINQITKDAINQAKEALGKAGVGAAPAANQSVAANGKGQAVSGPIYTPYIVPEQPVSTPPATRSGPGRGIEPPASRPIGTGGYYAGGGSRANYSDAQQSYQSYGGGSAAKSIYAVVPDRRNSAVNGQVYGRSPRFENRAAAPVSIDEKVKLPTYGSILPVRTIGAFFTLRQSSTARFELTRDVAGEGWALKRGTILVAQQQGSENDRAFLTLTGFVDPETNRFTRLNGDILGGDGGPGIKGKKRKIGGALGPILNRLANGGLILGQAALSRGNSTIIVPGGTLTGIGNDFGLSQSVISRREFVEVPGASPAYIMVTSLPKEVRGVDAEPPKQDAGADPTKQVAGDFLTDDELADLLSSGNPEQIRAALPRMSPDMRKVAELILGRQ